MKQIYNLMSRLRGEMSNRIEDSDIVDILEVLQEANEEIEMWKDSHDKVVRRLNEAESDHMETLSLLFKNK